MRALSFVPTSLLCSIPRKLVWTNMLRSSSIKEKNADDLMVNEVGPPVIRVLGLHGSGGTAKTFQQLLEVWNDALNGFQFTTSTIQGEVPVEDGFAWWRLGPGERSFSATSYDGYPVSEAAVLSHLKNNDDCELVIAHSQGAILTTAMLAQGRFGGETIPHPKVGYILNGVAWPNPYTAQLASLQVSGHPRVLLITGVNDKINPPEQAFRVKEALKKAGCNITVLLHPSGHAMPMPKTCEDDAWDKIELWIRNGIDDSSA
jgi:predicted esterase